MEREVGPGGGRTAAVWLMLTATRRRPGGLGSRRGLGACALSPLQPPPPDLEELRVTTRPPKGPAGLLRGFFESLQLAFSGTGQTTPGPPALLAEALLFSIRLRRLRRRSDGDTPPADWLVGEEGGLPPCGSADALVPKHVGLNPTSRLSEVLRYVCACVWKHRLYG